MKLTVTTQHLAKELSITQGIVEAKATIPALQMVLLEAKRGEDGKEGELSLSVTDLEISIRTSCPANVEVEGSIALPMRQLFDYVRLLPEADVAITSEPTKPVRIACGHSSATIQGMGAETFPDILAMPPPQESVVKLPVNVLADAVQKCVISVSTEDSHYALAAAQFTLRHDAAEMVSTDGHRLSLYIHQGKVEGLTEDASCLIARKALTELQKVLSEPDGDSATVGFAMTPKNIFFRAGRREFSCRQVEGKFPDYTRVLPTDLAVSLHLPKDALGAALRRARQFTDSRSRSVQLDVTSGSLQIKAASSGVGTDEESLSVDYSGEPISVGFNVDYILDFIAVCEGDTLAIRFRDSRSAAQVEVVDGDKARNFRYVIMPVRV